MGMTASSGSGKQPKPDINVTPLVDIVLVLLIIFMVVTPAMDKGEHIELPEMSKADKPKDDLSPIEVTMAFNGNLLVDKKRIPADQLESRLKQLHEEQPEGVVMLNADARLKYKLVRDTFKMMQDIGFKGVSLKVAEKKPEEVAQAH